MSKLLAIGEALVDIFDNNEVRVGGAPLNVCAAFSKLGGDASFVGKLSNDEYGKLIIDKMKECNIDTSCVTYCDAPTGKAYVKTKPDGDREFSFEINDSAYQLLNESEIKEEWFKDAFALHFCSVSLDDLPIKKAHYKAIEYAKKYNCLISFDLNIRLSLFKDHKKLKETIKEFIGYCNIIKLSKEELAWLEMDIQSLFINEVELIILTLAEDGARCYLKNNTMINSSASKVKVIDTTGAGDAFIGSFLYQLSKEKSIEKIGGYLDFSNKYCSMSISKKGAIDSYPTIKEMKNII